MLLLRQRIGTCLVMGSASVCWHGLVQRWASHLDCVLCSCLVLMEQRKVTCLVMGSAFWSDGTSWCGGGYRNWMMCIALVWCAAAEAAHTHLPGDGQCFLVRWHESVQRWASHLNGVLCPLISRSQCTGNCLVRVSASVRWHELVRWLTSHLDGVRCSCLVCCCGDSAQALVWLGAVLRFAGTSWCGG